MTTASNNENATTESVVPAQATDTPESQLAAPDDVALHFDTPAWVRPGESPAGSSVPQIPTQAAPTHDRIERPANVPTQARWVAHHKMRTATGLVIALIVLGTAAAAYALVSQDQRNLLPYVAIPVVVALGLWALMINTTPVVLTLNGSKLEIHLRGDSEVFDLSDPDVVVATSASDDPEWAVCFDRIDGTPITLTERQFDPSQLGPVLAYYRAQAQRRMADRLDRYSR